MAGSHEHKLTPQSVGLRAIAEGFRQIEKDDFVNMSKQSYVYESRYASIKQKREEWLSADRSRERR